MKESHLTRALIQLGLTEKEVSVYLSALQLGPATVLALSKKSRVKRTTVYSVLNSLIQKGLIQEEVHGIKDFFVAAEPEKLEKLLEAQRTDLLAVMPQIQALYKLKANESVIKHYEGIHALREVYQEILKLVRPGDDYYVLSDSKKWLSLDENFFTAFLEERSKLKAIIKHIFVSEPLSKLHVKGKRRANERFKFLPPGTKILTNLVIIPKRVFIHSLVPPFIGMVIENQSFIQMHREMYNLMWSSLPQDG